MQHSHKHTLLKFHIHICFFASNRLMETQLMLLNLRLQKGKLFFYKYYRRLFYTQYLQRFQFEEALKSAIHTDWLHHPQSKTFVLPGRCTTNMTIAAKRPICSM